MSSLSVFSVDSVFGDSEPVIFIFIGGFQCFCLSFVSVPLGELGIF